MRTEIPLVLLFILHTCTTDRDHRIQQNIKYESLNLLHQGSHDLAGIVIDRNDPVGLDNIPSRGKNDHPRFISYYFWNGKVEYVEYEKNGKILNEYAPVQFTSTTEATWNRVDFSYGSDSKFQWHQDPRK